MNLIQFAVNFWYYLQVYYYQKTEFDGAIGRKLGLSFIDLLVCP